MSEVTQLLSNYKDIRQKLRYPSNAVPDIGIDLHRKRLPDQGPKKVLGCEPAVECVVTVAEIQRPRVVALRMHDIEVAICDYFKIHRSALIGKGRQQRLVYPRQIMWHLAYEYAGLSNPQIGRLTGWRDHSTVIHGKRKIAAMILSDPVTAQIVQHLETVLGVRHEPKVNQPDSAVAPVSQLDLAEEQEIRLPQPEVCPVD